LILVERRGQLQLHAVGLAQGIVLGNGAIETAKIPQAMACLRDCFTDEAGSMPAR
jgi:hypothetical protein